MNHDIIRLIAYSLWLDNHHACPHLGDLDWWLMAEIVVKWSEPFAREADNVVKHHLSWHA
jgi:hypothetical protein